MKTLIAKPAICAPILALCAAMSGCAHDASLMSEVRFQANQDAVLQIISITDGKQGVGTGVVIAPNLAITNQHVVDGSPSLVMACAIDGPIRTCFKAKVVADDEVRDFAFVLIDGPFTQAVDLGDDRALHEGDPVYARLSVLDALLPSLVWGRYVNRMQPPYNEGPITLVFDLMAGPGASGGPVFDQDGRLVGLARFVTTAPGRSGAYAVPVSVIKRYLARHARK